MKKTPNTSLVQFWSLIHLTSEFNFYEKTKALLTQFWVRIYTPRELNFHEQKQKLY